VKRAGKRLRTLNLPVAAQNRPIATADFVGQASGLTVTAATVGRCEN